MSNIDFIDARQRLALGAAAVAVADLARQLRKSHEHRATGHMCYYPEVVP